MLWNTNYTIMAGSAEIENVAVKTLRISEQQKPVIPINEQIKYNRCDPLL